MRSNSNHPGVKALRAMRMADRWAHKKPIDPVIDPAWNRLKADEARAEADALMTPPPALLRGGGEVVAPSRMDEIFTPARNAMVSTLEDPNMISVEASEQRLEAAFNAGVLQAAMDASVSAQATNSLEKMLCHQLAAAHHVAMALVARVSAASLPPVEQARLSNAAARMMEVSQAACLAVHKLKTNGTQRVLVQYQQVNVSDGGQAVVAGKVGANPSRMTSKKRR